MLSVSIIGAGRLGGALAIALDHSGYEIQNLVSRSLKSLENIVPKLTSRPQLSIASEIEQTKFSPIVLIATPDAEIHLIAERLAASNTFGKKDQLIFLHTSGALSSEILRPLQKIDGSIGSLHPLVSVSNSEVGSKKFKNAYFCVEGEPAAVRVAQQIVTSLEGLSFNIEPAQKALYHAAAVMSSGHLVALFDLALEMLVKCGLGLVEAQKVLLPLVQSTIENLAQQKPAAALTGPFARADAETMKRHLAVLSDNVTALNVYCELGMQALKLAAEQNADAEKLHEMATILDSAKFIAKSEK